MTRFPSHDPDHPSPDPGFDPGPGFDHDFDKELLAAMTAFADNTPAPAIDALAIRRTVRRRTVLSGAVAAAAVVAIGTGAALLAPGSGPSPSGGLPAGPANASAPMSSGAPSPAGSAPAPGPSMAFGTPSPVMQPTDGVQVSVPPVVNLAKDAAVRALEAAGLRYEVHEFTDWNVPAGSVINSAPQAGHTAPEHSTVQVFVSKGRPGR
ncbi:PASTA domain-containing protein [Kitasatospora sp. NBC_01300]|uniref:PASTA domain-containing protein n=1 Tax=Kitasatospora sp. NBC_01300 TaxID=2903574 RepID=UPI00352F61E2|nr:PASTA domain-containing protein [Kitasatospora sp. NBC_01300]WSK08340.1 PASTA domain-containing protein [Kitasatospora sp. NBC_01300]